MTRRFVFLAAGLLAAVTLGITLALGSGSRAQGEPAAGQPPLPVSGQYIVILEPRADAAAVVADYGIGLRHRYQAALHGFAGAVPPARLGMLQGDPRVRTVVQDAIVNALQDQSLPTGVDRIDADQNATANINGSDDRVDATVAVLDTGVDLDHPDLNVDVGLSRSFSCLGGSSPDDKNGHGSHVAGTIAALDNAFGVVGVAPGAKLVAVRVLGPSGNACISDIAAGVDYVTSLNQDADPANNVDVVNMSLGWQDSGNAGLARTAVLRTAIQNSIATGIVYTVAAGNETDDVYGGDGLFGTGDDRVPAAFPEVATISAMADSDGAPGGIGPATSSGSDDSFASFSNFSHSVVAMNPVSSPGAAIDLVAPGVSILSTYKNGGYATGSGTSMATPHAAGLAALYVAVHGAPSDAAGAYAVRQALIDAGLPQGSACGFALQNDPDGNHESIGWAGGPCNEVAPTATTTPTSTSTPTNTPTPVNTSTSTATPTGVTATPTSTPGMCPPGWQKKGRC